MRSVRLDDEMDRRVRRAAEIEGVSVSEFLRRAASDRSERVLSTGAEDRLADVVGAIRSQGEQARRTGSAFTDALVAKRRSPP
jgi:Ribbon-helix-helix protein, copG family